MGGIVRDKTGQPQSGNADGSLPSGSWPSCEAEFKQLDGAMNGQSSDADVGSVRSMATRISRITKHIFAAIGKKSNELVHNSVPRRLYALAFVWQ